MRETLLLLKILIINIAASSVGGYTTAKYSYAYCEKTYNFLQTMEHIEAEQAYNELNKPQE
jgi:hypothetical protein